MYIRSIRQICVQSTNEMSFLDTFIKQNWEEVTLSIVNKTAKDVELALSKSRRDLEDFKALISPAAAPYLEQMAQLSHA